MPRTVSITLTDAPEDGEGIVLTCEFKPEQDLKTLYEGAEKDDAFSIAALSLLSTITELNDSAEDSEMILNGEKIGCSKAKS